MGKITPDVLPETVAAPEEQAPQTGVNPEVNAESVAAENTERPAQMSKSEKKRLAEIKRAKEEEAKADAELDSEEPEEEVALESVSSTVDAEQGETPRSGRMVELISADGRQLEVSISNDVWKGLRILVPVELEGEIRRILEEGGYYVKN